MKAIYYILWTRYYEDTPDYIDVQWEGNMEYEHVKDIPEDVLEKEGQIKIDYFVKKERILVMCLDIEAKTFSVKGKWWAKWEEQPQFEELIVQLSKQNKSNHQIKSNVFFLEHE